MANQNRKVWMIDLRATVLVDAADEDEALDVWRGGGEYELEVDTEGGPLRVTKLEGREPIPSRYVVVGGGAWWYGELGDQPLLVAPLHPVTGAPRFEEYTVPCDERQDALFHQARDRAISMLLAERE